jgi:hypothetical protein
MPEKESDRPHNLIVIITSNDEPANGHGRDDHNSQPSGVFRHVGAGEFDANGEKACCEDYAHYFEGNDIGVGAPRARIKYVGGMRAYDDTECSAKDDFVDVELCVHDQ